MQNDKTLIYSAHNTCENCSRAIGGIILCDDPMMMVFCSRPCYEAWAGSEKEERAPCS